MASLKLDSSKESNILLASKLRQIKENLEHGCGGEILQPPPPTPKHHPIEEASPTCDKKPYLMTKHFQFELNRNQTSFDHLFDQFKFDLAEHTRIPSPPKLTNVPVVSLKNVQYSENVSRQSSIRSLLNNNSNSNNNLTTRRRSPHLLNNYGGTNGGANLLLDKHEYELIADWDKYEMGNR